MTRDRCPSGSRATALLSLALLLLLGPSQSMAAARASESPEAAPPTAPAPLSERADDPAGACFDAARAGAGDAYVCDLAVQMARDSGSPVGLAAALANRSLVLAAQGRLQPALGDVDEALGLTPDSADLHGNRGNLLLRLGRPAEALSAHDRAIELRPQEALGYYNRAFSYLALGEPARAEDDVDTARALAQRRTRAAR